MNAVGLASDSQHFFYFLLCRKLYKTPFIWLIEGDRDRAKDGLELRKMYDGDDILNGPVSVLEVLIAFAIRIDEWLSGGEDGGYSWFMTMLHNLGLDEFTDDILTEPGAMEIVENRIEKWVERKYDFDGKGGIFPLRNATNDQRCDTFELQLQSYLKENRQLIGVDFG